jgi:regulator of RNase E activity RraA
MAKYPGVSAETLQALARFDTPTIANAVELWNIRPRNAGYMNSSITACYPKLPPMVGYALTTQFRSMSPPRGGDVYSGIAQQLEAFADFPGPPVIVFQDLDIPCAAATFGEVMCSTYKAFGAAGLITSGTGRDLDQVEALNFPAFTNGTICAHGYCHMIAQNVPVTVGGITIYPGDLLHGDRNGVTTIPIEIASEVPGVCQEVAEAEAIVLNYLKGSNLNVREFAAARAECGALIKAIEKRLSGK